MIVTAMGAGALDYIVKGCEDEEILYHIRCALKGNPIMSNKIHETVMQEYARLQQSEKSLLFFINNISKLTATEREMIKLLLQGYKVHEIAEARSVEVSTIKTQIKGLLRKFGCSRTKEIVQKMCIRDRTMDDIEAIDMDASGIVSAMLSGKVDAAATWSPNSLKILEEDANATKLADNMTFSDKTVSLASWICMPKYAEENRDVLVRFTRALFRCV